MKNILLPTDLSKNAYNAIQYAMELYRNESCMFYLLNVQKASNYTSDDLMISKPNTSIHHSLLYDNKIKLEGIIEKLKLNYHNNNHSFEAVLDFDIFIDALKQTIVSKNIDLIIMGTNGASNAKEVVFGSNTLQVIRKIDCPVLIIPQNFAFKKINSILFTIDSDSNFSSVGIHPLIDILTTYKAYLKVLMLNENEDLNSSGSHDVKKMKTFFKNIN